MTGSMIWCLVLLINVPSRLSSGTEMRSVCQGDVVELFRNVSFNNGSVVSIYINGDSQTLIGTWNSLSDFSIMPQYKNKIFFDELGTFWIRKIQRSDEHKYVLKNQIDTRTTTDEAQIFVMVAPSKNCRPKLLQADRVLIASLESKECGHPTASVKWLEYPGMSYMDKLTVKLPSGKESGTYYACVESPALKCVTDFKIPDYCSSFAVLANNNSAVSPEMIGISVILILMLIIVADVITKHVLRNKRKQGAETVSGEKVRRGMPSFSYSEQGMYRLDSGNVENPLLRRGMPSFSYSEQGMYRLDRGNVENPLLRRGKPSFSSSEQGMYRLDSGNVENPLLLREKTSLACGEQGKYRLDSGNVENTSFEAISYVETKSVKCIQSKDPEAPM